MYTITVTSLADSGTGTLRQAIADANAYTGTDEIEIVFDESLAGTLKLSSSLSLPSGVVVHLPEGVNIDLNSYTLNVYGTLAAEWETAADVITGTRSNYYHYFYVRDGGKVQLKNANINLANLGYVTVYSGGTLEMEGGSLYANYGVTVNGGGNMVLDGTTVRSNVTNSGTAVLGNCTLNSYLVQSGKLTIDNNTFKSYLQLSSTGNITGSGNTFTGDEVFRLSGYSGNTDDLAAMVGSITSGSAYIGLTGNLNTSTFTKTQGGLNLGYKSVGSVSIQADKTVTLEEGVCWDLNGYTLNVYGTLSAEWETAADVITGTRSNYYHYFYVRDGGKVQLKNANINLANLGYVTVYSGGTLEMEGGSLYANYGVRVNGGGTMTLNGTEVRSNVTNSGTAVLGNCTLNSYLVQSGKLTIDNNTFKSYLQLSSTGNITGSGNTFTGDEVFRLSGYSGNTDDLAAMVGSITSGSAYIGLTGDLNTSTFTKTQGGLNLGYKSVGSVSIQADKTVTLEEGVCLQMQNNNYLNVYGTLSAEWETAADVITGTRSNYYQYFYVRDGGKVQLKNANINLANLGYVTVYSGGTLEMEGGSLYANNGVTVNGGGNMVLDGTTVRSNVTNSGTAVLGNCTLNSYLVQSGKLTIDNNTFKSYLQLSSTGNITGSGNTFTGDEVFRLSGYSGNTDDLAAMVGSITSGSAYIGLTGNLNTSTFTKTQGGLNLGYKSVGSVSIQADKTVTLEEGVCWDLIGYTLNVYGTLSAEWETAADVITGTRSNYYQYFCVWDGGKVQLKNANVTGVEDIYMYSGGTLEMEGGTLDTRNYLSIQSGATATLDGVTVKDTIYNRGILTMSNSTVNGATYVYSGSSASITGCAINGTLDISMGSTSTTITGNDFSKTTLKLTDMASSTGVIDLSGNYWGTTDIDAVIAKIQGYTEDRVLISSILMAPPTQEFSFDATMAGNHRLSHLTMSLTLNFNRMVDADTVNAASILLTDAEGNKIAIQKYEVSGKKVTLYFDELPTGDYRVNCTTELKDVDGKSFTSSENFSSGITYHCLQIEHPRVLLFRSNSTVTDVFSYVDVFFDQVMDDSTISLDSVHLYAPDGQEIELTQMRKAGVSGNIFYRFYFDTVSSKGTYTLSVDQSVCNDWGMEMSADYRREIYVAAPDLTVGAELNVSSSTLGRYTSITYTVSNIGDAMTPGTWTDAVYLCRTQQWNEDEAILLGRYNRTEALSENGSYTASVKGLLADLEPGDYYVFVRTDESDRLSEDKENNNVSAVGTKISIGVPDFTGESVAGRLSSANETLYYAFTPTESGSYNLTVDNPNAMVMVTTVVNGKAINKKTTANSLHFSVFNAEAGTTYYIAIKGGKDTSYTTQIQKSEFAVYDSSFTNLAAGHPSTLTLVGSEFAEGLSVYVVDENGVRYDAERVVIVDSCQATVTFSLPEELAAGTALTLYVQDEADTVVKLEESLHIATFSDLVELKFSNMNGERHVGRVGWVWKADLYAENKAGYDVSNAIILITDTAEDFAMYYGYDDAKYKDRSALLFLGGADALTPEVMTAGESSKLGIYVKNYRSGVGAIQ